MGLFGSKMSVVPEKKQKLMLQVLGFFWCLHILFSQKYIIPKVTQDPDYQENNPSPPVSCAIFRHVWTACELFS